MGRYIKRFICLLSCALIGGWIWNGVTSKPLNEPEHNIDYTPLFAQKGRLDSRKRKIAPSQDVTRVLLFRIEWKERYVRSVVSELLMNSVLITDIQDPSLAGEVAGDLWEKLTSKIVRDCPSNMKMTDSLLLVIENSERGLAMIPIGVYSDSAPSDTISVPPNPGVLLTPQLERFPLV